MRKMMYKALALMLSLTLLCTGLIVVQAAETEADSNFAPMTTREFDALSTMGLLTEDFLTMSADSQVSRAQFIGGLYKMAGFSEDSVMMDVPFNDVKANTPHANAISYFYNAGYISGTSATTFSPNDKITYAQALKVMVDLLGYKETTLQTMGGYPTGYLNMATRLHLFDGLNIKSFDNVVSGDAAVVLFYNYGITPIAEDISYSSDGTVTYTSSEDRYPLSAYHKIYFAKGKMNDNGIVSLLGGSASTGSVVIGETRYNANGIDCQSYLGCMVNYYYQLADTTPALLWLMQDDETNALTLLRKDLATNDSKYGFANLVYYKNDEKLNAEIDTYADFVYNNQSYNGITLEQLKIESGEIKLIDNDNDGDYDLVIIEEFTNYFLSTVSVEREYLTDKYGKVLELKDFKNVFYIKDGKYITLEEVTSACIASCVESPNKEYLYVYLSGSGIGEKLNMIRTLNGETYYEFESGTYRKAHSLKTTTYAGVPVMTAGTSYKYFLDKAGDIAAVEALDNGALQYAWLIDKDTHKEAFGSATAAKVKLLMPDGTIVITNTADKITVIENNTPHSGTGTEILSKPNEYVVKVAFNSEGELRKIEFPTDITAEVKASQILMDKSKFTLDFVGDQDVYYRDNTMGGRFILTPNTVIFAKHKLNNGTTEYKTVRITDMPTARYCQNVKIYDGNEYGEAGVCTFNLRSGVNSIGSRYILVDEVETTVDSNGDPMVKITGLSAGQPVSCEIPSRADLSVDAFEDIDGLGDIKRGDVIAVFAISNEVYAAARYLRLSDPIMKFKDSSKGMYTSASASLAYGYLYSQGPTSIVLYRNDGYLWGGGKVAEPNGNSSLIVTRTTTGTANMQVMIYDAKADKIYVGDSDDLHQTAVPNADGSIDIDEHSTRVFIRREGVTVNEIIAAYY